MSDDLRRRVLDASAAIVARSGLAGLSMREVARAAGVSHQAPYHHFRGREGILAALAEEGFTRLADALERATPAANAPFASASAARLGAIGEAYVRFALDNPGPFRVLFRPDAVPLERFPSTLAAALRARAALDAAVAGCAADGLIASADADDLADAAWSTVHGAAVLSLDGPLGGPPGDPSAPGRRVAALLARLLDAGRARDLPAR
jgi:AcrR family transcriptional regulator